MLGEHGQVLGSEVGSLLTDKPDVAVAIRHPSIVQAIQENRLRVTVGWNGLAGDCGHRVPLFLFTLPAPAMQEFTREEAAYRRMLTGRQVHRTCDRLTLTPGGYCQSTALALDTRRSLPPFLPVFRGEDVAFGQLLRFFQPDAAIAYQPTSLLHVPAASRANPGGGLDGMAGHRSQSGLLVALLQLAAPSPAEAPADPGTLARRAQEILRGDFFELLAANQLRQEGEQMLRSCLAQLLAHPGAPGYWRRDLEAVIRSLHAAAQCPDFIYPAELSECRPAVERAGTLRDVLTAYFELIAAWPALWSAAVKLRERDGVTPARPIGGPGRP